MEKVVVFGDRDWADLAHWYLTHDSPYEVVAFTKDQDHMTGSQHRGLPLVPFEEVEQHYPPSTVKMLIPISYKMMNRVRADRFYEAKRKGYRLISYVSSNATVWRDLPCGENCLILEGAVIQPFAEIGDNVVIWSGGHIGHHTVIKDHVMIGPQATICGRCTIESFCFLGANCSVRDELTIASHSLVGAGAVVLRNTEAHEVYRAAEAVPIKVRADLIGTMRSGRKRKQGSGGVEARSDDESGASDGGPPMRSTLKRRGAEEG